MSEKKGKDWITLLNETVSARGIVQVGKELGYTTTAILLTISGKYPGYTSAIERRVMAIYGTTAIDCPVLGPEMGPISPDRCAEEYNAAKRVGSYGGNPFTSRLRSTCLKCTLRG